MIIGVWGGATSRTCTIRHALFAKDCVGLMDALGIKRAHMMGHSMGARVFQWFALDYPEKVRSLVLSGPGSGKYSDKLEDYPRGVPLDAALEMIEKGYREIPDDHWGPGFMFTDQFVQGASGGRQRVSGADRRRGAAVQMLFAPRRGAAMS